MVRALQEKETFMNKSRPVAERKAKPKQGKYEDKMLTLEEAAKYIRMAKSTLYACIHKNIIRHFRPVRGKILFNVDDLDAWLDVGEILPANYRRSPKKGGAMEN